jgi:hypothetical protein
MRRKKPANEWDVQMCFGARPGTQREATARLEKYYSTMGFVAVCGTDLMIRDLDADDDRADQAGSP